MRQGVLFVGHSHINCIKTAAMRGTASGHADAAFMQLREARYGRDPAARLAPPRFGDCNPLAVGKDLADASGSAAVTVLCPTGNEHNVVALINNPLTLRQGLLHDRLTGLFANYRNWLGYLARHVDSPAVVIPPPPPVESGEFVLNHPGRFSEALHKSGVAPSPIRLQMYLHQLRMIKEYASECGLEFVELPTEVMNERGFLHERFLGNDPTHANAAYGELILRHVSVLASQEKPSQTGQGRPPLTDNTHDRTGAVARQTPRQHPYLGLPDWSFWKQAVAQVPLQAFDPVVNVPFRITRTDKVATAGSCFAQHISKRLRTGGFQFLVTEQAPNVSEACEACGDYDFSARYGNVYTARQLVQLFDRAYGYFTPVDSHWSLPGHRFCDPFRPRIEADGYPSVEALIEDRQRHLAAVKEMFEQLDYFVFTLGLTECWVSRLDGAAYPLAPGVAGGEFDPARYEFVNFGVDEVARDLESFIRKLRLVNPGAKLILTVSPVPLAATYADSHVLVSTTYSKSVLRVAAEMASRSSAGVYYFPSFEIITGNYNRGRYFGPDLRAVTEAGVDHVMSVFMRHLTDAATAAPAHPAAGMAAEPDAEMEEMMALAEAACDEELLAKN